MKAILGWTFWESCLFVALIFGYGHGVEGARNLAAFMVVFQLLVILAAHSDAAQKAMAVKGRTVPFALARCLDGVAIGVFVWHGAWFLVGVQLLRIVIAEAAWVRAEMPEVRA